MRDGRASGRGERARVARRVRAMLADGQERDSDNDGSVGRVDTDVMPWLPSDDLTTATPSARMLVAPDPAPESLAAAAHRGSGLLARLTTRLAVRIDPGWRGALAVGIAVLIAAVVTGGWVLSARPHAIAVTDTGADRPAVASARGAPIPAGSHTPGPRDVRTPAGRPALLVVDVAGKVRHPGLYSLPAGSRIDDAVQAAGGPLPGVDLTTLNLAAKITDGQQIAVGMPGAVSGPAGSGGGPGRTPVPSRVDLNAATLEQLETLPGIGPVLGQHVIDWRVAHGRFATIDQLREVAGIGDVKFAALRSRVTV